MRSMSKKFETEQKERCGFVHVCIIHIICTLWTKCQTGTLQEHQTFALFGYRMVKGCLCLNFISLAVRGHGKYFDRFV